MNNQDKIMDFAADAAMYRKKYDALRAAIQTHRHNVWGDGPVGHDEDDQLYKVLEVKP